MSTDSRSFSNLSYHVGADWHVRCNTYAETTPILSVSGGPLSVLISTRDRDSDASAVEFARALAREARKFADEMERMNAAQLTDDSTGKAAGSDAA